MRSFPTFHLWALLAIGCATTGPATPTPERAAPTSEAAVMPNGLRYSKVSVMGKPIYTHPGCQVVVESTHLKGRCPKGYRCTEQSDERDPPGIQRCRGGSLEWRVTLDAAQAADDQQQLRERVRDSATKAGAQVEDREVGCTLGGAPASCHRLVASGSQGEVVVLLGVAPIGGRALLAQCRYPRAAEAQMGPVCGELFALTPAPGGP